MCTVGRSFGGRRGSGAGVTQCRQAWEVHLPLPTEQLSFPSCSECCRSIAAATPSQLCSSCIPEPAGEWGKAAGSSGLPTGLLGQSGTRSAASSLCCVRCAQFRVLHWPWTPQGREKPWCEVFHGAPAPPALLPPELEQLDAPFVLGEDWGLFHQRMEGKWSQAEALFPWQVSLAPWALLQHRNQGRGSPTRFLSRKGWWEVFEVSVCLYLTRFKDDES